MTTETARLARTSSALLVAAGLAVLAGCAQPVARPAPPAGTVTGTLPGAEAAAADTAADPAADASSAAPPAAQAAPAAAVVPAAVDAGDLAPAAAMVPGDIPELATWERDMVRYGKKWGPTLNPKRYDVGVRVNNSYYDALYVYLRIMDYTGYQEPWLTFAGWARHAWLDGRYSRPQYNMVGYHRFSLGMYEDFIRGNPTANAADPVPANTPLTLDPDFLGIRDLGAFAQPLFFVNEYCGPCTNVSRELAYTIVAHVVSERAGLPRVNHDAFGINEPRLQTYIRWVGQQMEQWRNASYAERGYQPDTEYHQMQPFMTGLTMKALIDFYEWELESGRDPNAYWEDPTPDQSWPTIVAALADFTNWLYSEARVRDVGGTPGSFVGKRLWDDSAGAFRYADRYSAYEGQTPDVVAPAADLNMLIAPAWAWVYKQTGDDRYREQGDAIFAGGVRNASPDWGSKQFNQQYIYSFDYVRWRSGL